MIETRRLEVEDFPLEDLHPHPLNEDLYSADEEEDRGLEDSISRCGLLTPIVATPDGTIVSGTRRWRIARKLGVKTGRVEFREFEDPELAIVEFNRQRNKKPRTIFLEKRLLEERLKPKAKEKQLAHLKPFKDSFLKVEETELPLHVDKAVAEKLDVSTGHLYKIGYVYSHEDVAKPVVERLDRGEITVNKAYQEVKKIAEPKPAEEQIEAWKCDSCGNMFTVEAPTRIDMCPFCVIDFQVWKAEKESS